MQYLVHNTRCARPAGPVVHRALDLRGGVAVTNFNSGRYGSGGAGRVWLSQVCVFTHA